MNYNDTVVKVMTLLKEKGVCRSSQKSHKECYSLLGKFLKDKGKEYSPDLREQWFSGIKGAIPKQRYVIWIKYVFQLEEMDDTGGIADRHLYLNLSDYDKLPDSWRTTLDAYLEARKTEYTSRTLQLTRIYCSTGLHLFCDQGIYKIENITYSSIIRIIETKLYCTEETRSVILNNLARMLLYCGENGQCSTDFVFLFQSPMYQHIGKLSAFSETNRIIIERTNRKSTNVSADCFYHTIDLFIEQLAKHHYIGTTLKLAKHSLTALYLFLSINGIGYHVDIMWSWFDEVRKTLGYSSLHWRRILRSYEDYHCTGSIQPGKKYNYKRTGYEELPEWCREAIGGLLHQKEREFRKTGTIKSYRCSCTRFCRFLAEKGYDSFLELTPGVIKEYASQDQHKTFTGRATHLLMVRIFLQYLNENKFIKRQNLAECLITGSAPTEKIADILTENQIQRIHTFRTNHKGKTELRDVAIVLLGLRMGLRVSDVLALRLQDIDWKKRQISIVMQKTRTQITLPMPVDVGNAIYSYLLSGRPDVENDYLFVRSRAPYGKLTGKVCTIALYRILPERRDVKGGGFHVTRRTFATNLLRNHAGINEVVDALGHRDTTSVMKYLFLDVDRSRKCALSLQEAGILLKGGLV